MANVTGGKKRDASSLAADDGTESRNPAPKEQAAPKCPVCLEFLLDPLAFACAHHVCQECGDEIAQRAEETKSTPKCPLCQQRSAPVPAHEYRERLSGWHADDLAAALADRAARSDPAVGAAALGQKLGLVVVIDRHPELSKETAAVCMQVVRKFYAWLDSPGALCTATNTTASSRADMSLTSAWSRFIRRKAVGTFIVCAKTQDCIVLMPENTMVYFSVSTGQQAFFFGFLAALANVGRKLVLETL